MIVVAFLAEAFNILMLLAVITMEILFGIACKQLMKLKGSDNSYWWFMIGFVLSFVGVIISMLMPDKSPPKPEPPEFTTISAPPYQPAYQPQYQPPILNEQNAVRCPHCLELTPNSSQYCIKCGCKLN